MEYLFNFFMPLSQEVIAFSESLPDTSVGVHVKKFTSKQEPLLLKKSIVIFSVFNEFDGDISRHQSVSDKIRKAFYSLHTGNWQSNIIDLGYLKFDTDFENTGLILKELITDLIKNQLVPIVIGNSQAYTYFLYRSFDTLEKRVNLCVADAQFDLGQLSEGLSDINYLSHIVMDKPNNLLNFANLGYQTYLNAQDEIALLDSMLFEALRLGEVKNNLTLAEPVLRETDVFSVDLSVIKASELPNIDNLHINGFTAEELCQICRYAGISDFLSIFAVFDNSGFVEPNYYKVQLLSQMLWYFVDGYHLRTSEYPDSQLKNFKKYNVMIEDEAFTFYKSNLTDRWWMEIILEQDNKNKRRALVPCTQQDYVVATNKKVPERWYNNRKKLSV